MLTELISNKSIKPKEKTEIISEWLINGALPTQELLAFCSKAKAPLVATCIEALEFASNKKPKLIDETVFDFVTSKLADKAPRIKWESAKVIANTAHLFTKKLGPAIEHLLNNTNHEGTVVRWSAALALGEILKLNTKHNKLLLPELEKIVAGEEKNSIRKIYADALKKLS